MAEEIVDLAEDTLDEVITSREENLNAEQELLNRQEPERKIISLDEAKVGFIVGVDQNGEWIWQSFGRQASLDSLMGCLYHAQRQLSMIYDNNTGRGERRVHEVGIAVIQLGETVIGKVDQLLQAVGVKQRRGTDV